MQLSEMELEILEQIALGNTEIKTVAESLNKDISRIYRIRKQLTEKGILNLSRNILNPKKAAHVALLFQLLIKHPNLIQLLSESGLPILAELLEPKTVEEITIKTGYQKSMIYRKIRQAMNISAVIPTDNHRYLINEKIWKNLKDFLVEYKIHQETTDARVPANSTIYYKDKNEIVFANNNDFDASFTGFSAYEQYGIKLLLTTNYYYLPKKALSKQEVFMHSLYITQKETDIRNLTFVGLFYVKYKNKLQRIKHPIVDNIKLILEGKTIEGYPALRTLKEKAEVYDIRF